MSVDMGICHTSYCSNILQYIIIQFSLYYNILYRLDGQEKVTYIQSG